MLQWLLRVIYSRITANDYHNNNNDDDSKDKVHNISSHISHSIKTQTTINHDQYLIYYFIKPTIRQVKDTLLILGYCLQSSPSYIIFPQS
jgi:hypothetical protein